MRIKVRILKMYFFNNKYCDYVINVLATIVDWPPLDVAHPMIKKQEAFICTQNVAFFFPFLFYVICTISNFMIIFYKPVI